MEWITNKIGEDYKNWKGFDGLKGGDKIFISAPTGSGKTYFVLNVLLPYFSSINKKILFLVNRRILKQQIEKEISCIPFDQQKYICVDLYQSLENRFCTVDYLGYQIVPYVNMNIHVEQHGAKGYKACERIQEFDCVVCDECHYFFADSNYNTNTAISFRLTNEYFERKIRIFMSATIEDFQEYITNEEKNIVLERSPIYHFCSKNPGAGRIWNTGEDYSYSLNRDYNYLNINILNNRNDIISLVTEGSEKWLIFVDNIKYGERLENELKELYKNDEKEKDVATEIVMLSASYEENEESLEQVHNVVEKNKFTARIIISTSVMDNGINIKDIELRNLIILADNRVEFIQMLGRKRRDTTTLKLYIFKQKEDYFKKRLNQVQELLRIANKYLNVFENKIKKNLLEEKELYKITFEREKYLVMNMHRYIMNDIMSEKIEMSKVKKLFLVYNGVLYVNQLSVENYKKLHDYYNKVLHRFKEEGDDAFVREQLEWLGKTSAEIDEIIKNSSTSILEKYKADVIDKMNQIVGREMSKQENIAFKKTIKDKLLYIIDKMGKTNSDYQKVYDALSKLDRPLSSNNMDFLCNSCELPFSMEVNERRKGKESTYIIRNSDTNN